MRAERLRPGGSPLRQYVITARNQAEGGSGEEHVVAPLHFCAGLGNVDGVSTPTRPAAARAAAEDALTTQIRLATSVGVRLISVELTMGSFLAHNMSLTPSARGLLQKVRELAPSSFFVLRVTFYGGVASAENPEVVLQSAANETLFPCGCTSIADGLTCASPTARWAATAARQLKLLLRAADAVVPGRIVAVQLGGLSSFEWMLPHPPNIPDGMYPDYSNVMRQEWCSAHAEADGCRVPTSKERNTPDGGSNLFVGITGNASASQVVEWNNFTAHQVARTISTLAAAAKQVSGGRIFTFAFYGYIFHSYSALPFTGHAALGWLLQQPAIDAISSPTLYSSAARGPHGGVLANGPWNAPAAVGKLWIVEADLRTVLAVDPHQQRFRFGVQTLQQSCDVLRKYVWATLMSGNGLYMYDLSSAGWFGSSKTLETGRQLWKCIAEARDSLHSVSQTASTLQQQANKTEHGSTILLVFDELSALHWPVGLNQQIIGHISTNSSTRSILGASWQKAQLFQPPTMLLPSIGAPVRFALVSSLLSEPMSAWTSELLDNAALVVMVNAYRLNDQAIAAIQARVHTSNRTIVYFHGPAAIRGSDGALDGHGPSKLLGNAMQMATKPSALRSIFVQPHRTEAINFKSMPNFRPLQNRTLGSAAGGDPLVEQAIVWPWWQCSAGILPRHRSNGAASLSCVTLGTLLQSSSVGTLCWCEHANHRTLFSAQPGLPLSAWRGIVAAAGVHVWAGPNDTDVGATDEGAYVDTVSLNSATIFLIVRVSPPPPGGRSELVRATIHLPWRASRVEDALTGRAMCFDCRHFVDVRVLNVTCGYYVRNTTY
jgi:hypothetical protein